MTMTQCSKFRLKIKNVAGVSQSLKQTVNKNMASPLLCSDKDNMRTTCITLSKLMRTQHGNKEIRDHLESLERLS